MSGFNGIEPEAAGRFANGVSNTSRKCVIARTGAGVHTVTLFDPLTAVEGCFQAQVEGAAVANSDIALIEHTSDTVKTIRTARAGVATDIVFSFLFSRFGPV